MEAVREPLPSMHRNTMGGLITFGVHCKDILRSLIGKGISSVHDFDEGR